MNPPKPVLVSRYALFFFCSSWLTSSSPFPSFNVLPKLTDLLLFGLVLSIVVFALLTIRIFFSHLAQHWQAARPAWPMTARVHKSKLDILLKVFLVVPEEQIAIFVTIREFLCHVVCFNLKNKE